MSCGPSPGPSPGWLLMAPPDVRAFEFSHGSHGPDEFSAYLRSHLLSTSFLSSLPVTDRAMRGLSNRSLRTAGTAADLGRASCTLCS